MNLKNDNTMPKNWKDTIEKAQISALLLKNIPDNISPIYQEIIVCLKESCFTATILLMRKMLVHIAIHLGDDPHESFYEYLNYIQSKIALSEESLNILTHLRIEANKVSHEISLASPKNVLQYLHAINEILTKNEF